MKIIHSSLITAALIAILAVSCSSGIDNPAFPDAEIQDLTNSRGAADVGGSKMLWGYWDVVIDTENWTVETVPMRGVEFTANVTMFLQPPAGTTANMKIKFTDQSQFPTQGLLDVEVTLVHPFPGLNQFTGFDVVGVFIHHGDHLSKYDSNIFYSRTNEVARLLNPDGYTRWFNPNEFPNPKLFGFTPGALGTQNVKFSATLNGYKYFADGLTANADVVDFLHNPSNIEKRCLFSTTASNTRLYKLKFPMISSVPSVTFQYAVIANWEPPANVPPLNIPGDWPIEANAREPFYLDVKNNGSQLFYSNGSGGGVVRIRAELFDWNSQFNPEGILGEFTSVIVESPNADVAGNYLLFTPEDFVDYIQPGTTISSVAELEFTGVEPKSTDDVEFLLTIVAKEDELYDQGFGEPAPDATVASYWYFTIPVTDNPCGNFSVTGAIPPEAESGMIYDEFTVLGENFQNGSNLAVDIVDGSDVVASGENVLWVDSSTITCELSFCGVNPGVYDLRVTNGCEPVSYQSIEYTVGPDPLKNIDLRPGIQIRDLGIRETTGEPYVLFADGQIWIYTEDYSSGTYKITNAALDFIDVLDNGDACLGDSTGSGQFIWFMNGNYFQTWGYSGNMMDVTETDPPGLGDRAYFWQNGGSYILSTRRTPTAYGGNITYFYFVGSGPGLVNLSAFKAMHTSRQNTDSSYEMWIYALEGAPEFAIERYDYSAAGGGHSAYHDLTICGTQGDGNYQLNDPKDISGDEDDNIYILDILSTGQRVIKVYDMNGTYLGQFGDNVSISGTPLRLDVDEGDGEVHVAHTNGVSVFRPCEIPI
ncbi:MAG TPA: hypothetical protein ENN67_06115 [Firmicutes bacterium]|nr:hypothetical protein [Bacillota bacterium]